MTISTTLLSKGRLLSLSKRARTSSSVVRFVRHHSSMPQQESLLEEAETVWNHHKTTLPQASLPLISSSHSPLPLNSQQQHDSNNKNDSTSVPREHLKSPTELTFTGNHKVPITSTLHIVTPNEDTPRGTWPVFRLMDESGVFRPPDGNHSLHRRPTVPPAASTTDLDTLQAHLQHHHPHVSHILSTCGLLQDSQYEYPDTQSNNTLLRAYTQMIRLREMDTILQNAQRQGRISFYMTCRGEEAIHIGAASALSGSDTVLAQYREAGILMWRGFTLEQFCNQCFSTDLDLGKGRQMPVHYGSRALNYHTISSPLGTQLPQAVGVAYHSKLKGDGSVTACFFGDGCASTTDFHSALNFAATLQVPLLFICRNNGYAISTPVSEQYAGDGIVCRAPGYGMAGIRVDGNDLFAVYAAIQACRDYALRENAPVLVELMTYRQGHHSTSDDSTRYRALEEVHAHQYVSDPLKRMQAFFESQEVVDETWMLSVRDEEKLAVMKAMELAERRPKPPLEELFQDVYHEVPPHLQRQEEELHAHIAKYPDRYEP